MKKVLSLIIVSLLMVYMAFSANVYTTKSATAIKATPNIDAVIDELWADAQEVEVNLVNKTIIPSESTTTGKVKFAWDENYFYVLAVVTDSDVWDTASEGTASEDMDSIEFGIDERNSKGVENMNTEDITTGVFRIGTNDSEISGFGGWFLEKQSEVKGKCIKTDTGYIAEMAIPWSTITPAEDTVISLEVQINDNSEGVKRTGLITWNSEECLGWRDSESHGEITLEGEPAATTIEADTTKAATTETIQPTSTTSPTTGNSNILLYIIIAVLLIAGLVTVMFIFIIRKNN